MAANSQYANIARSAAADALAALCNSGYIKGYTGTQPATAETALSGNTLLCTLRFGATAFAAAVAGVITANAITSDTNAAATGTVTFFRIFKSDGTSVVMDVNAATAAACVVMNSTAIQSGAAVSISSLTVTVAAAGS